LSHFIKIIREILFIETYCKEEKEIKRKFRKNLKIAEKFVRKEIEAIEKEIL